MQRRSFLGFVAGGTLGIAGCARSTDTAPSGEATAATDEPSEDEPPGEPDRAERDSGTTPTDDNGSDQQTSTMSALPDACPTTVGLAVDWPTDLTETTVESFVESYEHVYYRDEVVEYEPESSLDSYELRGGVTAGPQRRGDGWELTYAGNGGMYRPTLLMGARRTEPPDDADVVAVADIDDEALVELIAEAAETGEAELAVDTPGEAVDRYVDLLASLTDDVEELSGRGDEASLSVAVNGTTVTLTVTATNFHGDYSWRVRYYVDDRVVRRTADEDADPRNGTLLECPTRE